MGSYYGQMRANFWRASTWTQELAKHDVLVMPPQILLNILESSFIQVRPPCGHSGHSMPARAHIPPSH